MSLRGQHVQRMRSGVATYEGRGVHERLPDSDQTLHLSDQGVVVTRRPSAGGGLSLVGSHSLVADALAAGTLEGPKGVGEGLVGGLELLEGAQSVRLVTVTASLLPRQPGTDGVVDRAEETAVRAREDPETLAVLSSAAIAAAWRMSIWPAPRAGVAYAIVSVLRSSRSAYAVESYRWRDARHSAHIQPRSDRHLP